MGKSWRREGADRTELRALLAEYFSEQDSVQQWIEECCDAGGRGISDTTENLFTSWKAWATANGEKPGTKKWFSQVLQRQGFEPVRETPNHRGKRGFLRISLRPKDTSDQWQNRLEDD